LASEKDRSAEIIAAATRLFAAQGFDKTTTRDICKAIGMSHAMLYYYFKDKEAILNRILQDILSGGLKQFKAIAESKHGLHVKLVDVINMYARFHVVETDKVKIFIHERKSLSSSHKRLLDKKQKEYLNILREMLDDLKETGDMVPLDTTMSAFALFGMVHWTCGWYNPAGRVPPQELAETIAHIYTKGILKK
jgi:AcrR family transcriptional regulator